MNYEAAVTEVAKNCAQIVYIFLLRKGTERIEFSETMLYNLLILPNGKIEVRILLKYRNFAVE